MHPVINSFPLSVFLYLLSALFLSISRSFVISGCHYLCIEHVISFVFYILRYFFLPLCIYFCLYLCICFVRYFFLPLFVSFGLSLGISLVRCLLMISVFIPVYISFGLYSRAI